MGESAPFVFCILQKHKVLWILRVHTNESKCIALICTIKMRNILSSFRCYQEKMQVIVQVAVLIFM